MHDYNTLELNTFPVLTQGGKPVYSNLPEKNIALKCFLALFSQRYL